MKTFKATIIKICMTGLFVGAGFLLFSQPPPPPPAGGADPRIDNNRLGAAPIDGGLGILLALGLAYGGKKAYRAVKTTKEKKK